MESRRQMQMLLRVAFRRVLSAFLCLPSVFLAAPATAQSSVAQSIPVADSRLIEIKVTGTKRFTQAEVAAASGLPLGATVDNEVFRKAARQLGESGAFNDISFTYTFSSAGTKLAFQVTDADKFVPAHFADFVWFTEQELLQKVHERVPLFNGELPTTGRLPDQVSDVLQALLVENGVPGHVEYSRTGAGHVEAIDYAVANVIIRIRQVKFTGAGPSELPDLEAAAEKLFGRDYYRALIRNFVEHSVLPVYHERGYLKASCGTAQPKVVKDAKAEGGTDAVSDKQAVTLVDVNVPIIPGTQYKLAGWTWSDNKNISAATLQPLLHFTTGQPADTVQLEKDLRAVQMLYGSRGYVTATIKAKAEFDEAADTVSYQLAVSEGPVYHMGELEFRGIDNNLTAKLRAAWKIRPGDVYDATYLKEFLPLARKLLPASMDWDVAPHVTAIARDQVVDVDLQYTAKAPQ